MIKILNKNTLLAILVAALAAMCANSIYSPIAFGNEQQRREKDVKERLVAIRLAEEAFKKATGYYTDNLALLVEQGLMADSMQYIPYTEKNKFEISTAVFTTKSGRRIPLMECGARYSDFMSGEDPKAIKRLAGTAALKGVYPGLRIGDITKPNNNAGNWE